VAKASLARAKQWSEEQRRMKSPVATTPSLDPIERDIRIKTAFAKESPKKDPPTKKKPQTRVAALHYQISLLKHMLLQLKQVFQIQDFQERKMRKEKNAFLN
jgi:hypothetical protein